MPRADQPQPPAEKRAMRVDEFCKAYGFCRTKFYALVARRELRAVKSGHHTLISADEAQRWFNSLPPLELGTPREPPRHLRRRPRRAGSRSRGKAVIGGGS
jgi:excisionase family DNA binding protein